MNIDFTVLKVWTFKEWRSVLIGLNCASGTVFGHCSVILNSNFQGGTVLGLNCARGAIFVDFARSSDLLDCLLPELSLLFPCESG